MPCFAKLRTFHTNNVSHVQEPHIDKDLRSRLYTILVVPKSYTVFQWDSLTIVWSDGTEGTWTGSESCNEGTTQRKRRVSVVQWFVDFCLGRERVTDRVPAGVLVEI